MKTKLICIFLCAFFIISQNGLAKESSGQSNIDKNSYSVQSVKENKPIARGYNYSPYIQVGGSRFFKVGTAKGAMGLDAFVPLWQSYSDRLVFTHVRFFDRTGKPFEGNIHLGYRYMDSEKDHLYGVYGAFDRKRTEFGNYFNQLTVGVEGWFRKFFIGGNFYQPIGDTSKFIGITNETANLDRIQNNIWITEDRTHEKAMGGGDAEVGYEVARGLIGYVGGYYFKAKDVETIYGPKGRLTYDWSLESGKRIWGVFDKFGLEAGVQRDNPRGTTYYVGVNARIGLLPNKGAKLEGVSRHMVDLVRRDVDIVSGHSIEAIRDLYRDDSGKVVMVHEIVGDDSGIIDSKDLRRAFAHQAKVILVKGHISGVDQDAKDLLSGNKRLVFRNSMLIKTPAGKVIPVDISHPSGKEGSISREAIQDIAGRSNRTSRRTVLAPSSQHIKDEVFIIKPKVKSIDSNVKGVRPEKQGQTPSSTDKDEFSKNQRRSDLGSDAVFSGVEKEDEQVKVDPVPVVEKKDEPVKLDPVPVVEKKDEPVKLDPVPVVEKKDEPIKLDPVPVVKKKDEPIKLDPAPVVEKKDEPVKLDPVSVVEKEDEQVKFDSVRQDAQDEGVDIESQNTDKEQPGFFKRAWKKMFGASKEDGSGSSEDKLVIEKKDEQVQSDPVSVVENEDGQVPSGVGVKEFVDYGIDGATPPMANLGRVVGSKAPEMIDYFAEGSTTPAAYVGRVVGNNMYKVGESAAGASTAPSANLGNSIGKGIKESIFSSKELD